MADRRPAAEPAEQEILVQEELAGLPPNPGLMTLEPEQLRQRVDRMDRHAGAGEERLGPESLDQPSVLVAGASVHAENGVAKGPAFGVHRDHRLALDRERQRPGRFPGVLRDSLLEGLPGEGPDPLGVLLGPVRLGRQDRVLPRRLRQDAPIASKTIALQPVVPTSRPINDIAQASFTRTPAVVWRHTGLVVARAKRA